MTASQRQWLIDNGYNPTEYDLTPDGQIISTAPEKVSTPAAFGGNMLKSLLPSAAGLYAGASAGSLAGMAGGPAAPITVPLAAIVGGLAGGYGAGKLQDMAVDKFAPEANEFLARAEEQHPIASYLGGFAPNALALKPSLTGLKALTQPGMGLTRSPAFRDAVANVGANVAGSTAGQLVDMSQGGEFSPGRFAADVALGSVFNDPNRIGRKLGLHSTPALPEHEPLDLLRAKTDQYTAENPMPETVPSENETTAPGVRSGMDADEYANWWKEAPQTSTLAAIAKAAKAAKLKLPRERLAEIAGEPYVNEILRGDYTNWPDFIHQQAANALESAYADPRWQAWQSMEEGQKPYSESVERKNTPDYPLASGSKESMVTWEDAAPRQEFDRTDKVLTAEDAAVQSRVGSAVEMAKARIEAARAEEARTKLAAAEAERAALGEQIGAGRERATQRRQEYDDAVAQRQAVEAQWAAEASAERRQNNDIILERQKAQEAAVARAEQAAREMQSRMQAAQAEESARIREHNRAMEAGLLSARDREVASTQRNYERQSYEQLLKKHQADLAEYKAFIDRATAEKARKVAERELAARENAWQEPTPQDQAAIDAVAQRNAAKSLEIGADEQVRLNDAEAAQGLLNEAADLRAAEELGQGDAAKLAALRQNEATAQELRDELYSRLQRNTDAEGPKLTQEALDKMAAIAAKRGLTVKFEALPDANGQWIFRDANGKPVVKLDPLNARVDTIVEEVGHDVFQRSATPRMQKSLSEAVEENATYRLYKEELTRERAEGKNKHTDQQIEDIAREEGFMAEFRQKYPEVSSKDMASWWKAFKASMKSMAGMRLSPEEAMSWMYYATHEHTPWTESFNARGAVRNAEREQKRRNPAAAEIDRLTSKGDPLHADLGNGFKNSYNTRDFKTAQWGDKASAEVGKLSTEQKLQLNRLLESEFDTGRASTVPVELKPAYQAIRQTFTTVADDYNANGFQIRTDKGTRARGKDPFYFPMHIVDPKVNEVFADHTRAPEQQMLRDSFIKHYTDYYLRNTPGATPSDAATYAEGQYAEARAEMNTPTTIESAGFKGARKPQGPPLPPSWRSQDLAHTLSNYIKRSATDFAFQKHIEGNQQLMAALGAKTHRNGAPIDPAILASTQDVRSEPEVQNIIREFSGAPARSSVGTMAGAASAISQAALGPVSRTKDIVGTAAKGLAFLQPTDYVKGLVDFAGRLANWSKTAERSYASGLNRRDSAAQMRAVMGVQDMVSNHMSKAAEFISKATGLNKLEQTARVVAQAWGDTIISLTKARAMAGDMDSIKFLDKLSPDWRTRDSLDLSAQMGRVLQGTYDMRSLPAWMLQGPAAPYLAWSKWSMGQFNNFMDYAMKPAMEGNVAPLVGQLFIGLAGGSAVQAVSEWMNNRENKDINWNELTSWLDENGNELGTDGAQLLGQKLLTLVQNVGTFGFAGDLAKTSLDAIAGGSQGVGALPVADTVIDTGKRTAAALKAIDDGEDVGRVMRQLILDLGKGHVQVVRAASNWLDTDANLDYSDKRKRRLYDELTGEKSGGQTFAISYSNLGERDLDKLTEPEDIGTAAGRLIEKAAERSQNEEEFAREIRKLTTAQNGVMPNPERQPAKVAGYLSWLEGAEPGSAGDTVERYRTRQGMAEYKKALIEAGAGLR